MTVGFSKALSGHAGAFLWISEGFKQVYMGFTEFVKELGVSRDARLYTCKLQLVQPARKNPESS